MVREENVKLMSKIAIYEKRKGKTEIPMNTYYKGDYVRLHCLKAVVSATVVFVLVAAMVVVYKLNYILANVLKIDYRELVFHILVAYGVWVCFYWLIARILYARKYEKARPNIIVYNHNLKKLQENAQKKVVRKKGGVSIGDDFIDF